MKLSTFITGGMLLLATFVAQGQVEEEVGKENTIEGQFIDVIEKSNNWEHFKVVPKQKLNALKKSIQDSLNVQKQLILEKNSTIKSSEQKINDLKTQIENLQNSFDKLKNEKDSVSLFGVLLSKGLYSSIVWGIIVALGSLLAFYIFRFSKSNAVTKRSIKDLEDLQNEYEDYKTKSIERDQKLRRQLQDEINKNRGV